jgi:DMSO/TMAO reductase YedYZ heme-binding membrane subunit
MTDSTISRAAAPRPAGRKIPWWLFAAVLTGVVAIAAGSLATWGRGEEGLLHVTRYTARFSFLIFVTVFAAGALAQLFPNDLTRWLKRKRRYLGLSFALAHFLHLGALTSYFVAIGEAPDTVTIIGGGGAYVFIALMALTSNDWSVRRLGPKNWRRLHLTGIAYVWLIFMNSYIGRLASETPPEPKVIFAITAGLGFLALGLRIAAWIARRRTRSQAVVR